MINFKGGYIARLHSKLEHVFAFVNSTKVSYLDDYIPL